MANEPNGYCKRKKEKEKIATIACSKPHRHCHCHHCSSFIVIPFRKLFLGLIPVDTTHTHKPLKQILTILFFIEISIRLLFCCCWYTVVVAFYVISEWIETGNWQCALCNILCKRWMSILHSLDTTYCVSVCVNKGINRIKIDWNIFACVFECDV